MADLTCTTPFLLYPSLVIILFFYSINHHNQIFSSVLDDDPSCRLSSSPQAVFSSLRIFPFRSSSSCLNITSNNNSTSEVVVVEEVDEAVERIEEGLAMARAAIRKAGEENLRRDRTNNSDVGFVSSGSVYLNAFTFHQLRPFLSPHFF
ncbi:hypothetical protein ARALYDRAFT_487944, partial [Arabidopsis lyrata subsp. lyrata]